MKGFLILTALFGMSRAFSSFGGDHGGGFGGGPGGVVSKRDGDGTTSQIYDLILQTLDKARQGISAYDLGEATNNIQEAADAYIDANGGEVPAQDIDAVIAKAAAKFNGIVAVSALFDDPLSYTATVMDSALTLWNGLVTTGKELEQAGQSPNPAIAAISMTSEAIMRNVLLTQGMVTYMGDQPQTDTTKPAKRWEVTGNVGYGPGGPSVSVGVSHSWRRRELSERGWSIEGGGSYSGGNIGAHVGLSYSWRRR